MAALKYINSLKSYYIRLKSSPLFRDSFWSLLGSAVGRGLSLIAGILVARFLGKEIYGEYGIIKTTLIYIEIFSTFGLGYTATKYIAEFKDKASALVPLICKDTLKITAVTSSIMALLVLIFAEQIAVIIDAPHLSNTLRITAAGVIVNAINVAQIGILSGFADFKVIARNTTISGILTFILTASLTYFFGLNGAVFALVLSYGVQCLINNISVRKLLKGFEVSKSDDRGLLKELLKFSFPIALQESLYSITSWAISYMLIKMSGYGELGLYSAAGQWAAIIGFIPNILRNVTLSYLSSSMTDHLTHNKTMRIMLLVNVVSTSALFLGIFLFSNLICSFYGDTFVGLKPVLLVQTGGAIIAAAVNVYVQEFMSRGKNWFIFFSKIIRDIGAILVAFLALKLFVDNAALLLSISVFLSSFIFLVILSFSYRKTNTKDGCTSDE